MSFCQSSADTPASAPPPVWTPPSGFSCFHESGFSRSSLLLAEEPLSLFQSSAEVTAYAAGTETARTAVTAADANRVRAERMGTNPFATPALAGWLSAHRITGAT